jgi:hypothetical protein
MVTAEGLRRFAAKRKAETKKAATLGVSMERVDETLPESLAESLPESLHKKSTDDGSPL